LGFLVCIDPDDLQTLTGQKRSLGRVVIRGPQVSLISPEEGMEEIANPFLAAEEEDEE
jgi:U6 snRNA-associated Sm-like protein LSm7